MTKTAYVELKSGRVQAPGVWRAVVRVNLRAQQGDDGGGGGGGRGLHSSTSQLNVSTFVDCRRPLFGMT